MLIPGDPKKRCCPPVKVGASGGQVVSRVLAEVQLTVGLVGPKLILWLWCQTQNAQLGKINLEVGQILTLFP